MICKIHKMSWDSNAEEFYCTECGLIVKGNNKLIN